jgi:hypothetical protein
MNRLLALSAAAIIASPYGAEAQSISNAFPPVGTSGAVACLLSSNCAISGTWTAPTNASLIDSSTNLATDAFVQGAIARVASANNMVITGGTYSFATQATVAPVVSISTSGGAVTGVSILAGGSGVAVGDLFVPPGGNGDSLFVVTAVSGGAATAVTIVSGGTGYTNVISISRIIATSRVRNFVLTGTLTSNVTIIMMGGTPLSSSTELNMANLTTGGFTVTVCQAPNASTDACSGGATVLLPKGVNNSSSMPMWSDGLGNVVYAIPQATFSRIGSTTVAGLTQFDPSPVAGDRAVVTDAVACTFLTALTGGGATICPVVYTTLWVGG